MSKNIEINIKGSDGEYEVLYPRVSSGNSFVNTEILQKFGLDENGSMEDVLNKLGSYNEYWWKEIIPEHKKGTVEMVEFDGAKGSAITICSSGNVYDDYSYYSTEYTVDNNGVFSLINPTKMTSSIMTNDTATISWCNTNLRGKYLRTNGINWNVLYYIPEDMEFGKSSANLGGLYEVESGDDSDWYYIKLNTDATSSAVKAKKLIWNYNTIPAVENYVTSSDINAYPHGEFEDYEIKEDIAYAGTELLSIGSTSNSNSMEVSDSIEIVNGKIQLKEPITQITASVSNLNANARGHYGIPRLPNTGTGYDYPNFLTEVCYIPSDAVFSSSSSKIYLSKCTSLKVVPKGKYYEFLGKPFENCKKIGNVELIGSYILPQTNQSSGSVLLEGFKNFDKNYLYFVQYRLDTNYSLRSTSTFKNRGLYATIQQGTNASSSVLYNLFNVNFTLDSSETKPNIDIPIHWQANNIVFFTPESNTNLYDKFSRNNWMGLLNFPNTSLSFDGIGDKDYYFYFNNSIYANNYIYFNYENEHKLNLYRVKIFDFETP